VEERQRQVLTRGSNETLEVLGEWLVIVHWRSAKDADASMASVEKAPAAAPFMSKIEASTMSMKRYQK